MLLPLLLNCRASLLRRSLRRGWPLNVFASPLRRRGRAGALHILLPGTSFLRRSLLSLLGRRGRSLRRLPLVVLPHHVVARLVTVILVVKLVLLLRTGIAIP